MSQTEKRTQIYLTADQHRAALDLAHRRGTSMASVVREALTQYLRAPQPGSRAPWEGDPALELIGAIALPPLAPGAELNEAIDSIVYDEEPSSWSSRTPPDSSPSPTRTTRGTKKPLKRGEGFHKKAKPS